MPQGVLVQVQSSAPFLLMKYLLPVAIVLFFFVAVWSVYRVGRRSDLSISLHIAQSRLTIWVFRIIGTVATIFATIALYGVTLPNHNASALTYAVYGVLLVEVLVTALIPHVEGTWRGNVHNIAAWGLCFSIPIITAVSLFMNLSLFAFWYTAMTLSVEMILLILALSRPSLRKWFLQFQSSYLALFFGLLAMLTFV